MDVCEGMLFLANQNVSKTSSLIVLCNATSFHVNVLYERIPNASLIYHFRFTQSYGWPTRGNGYDLIHCTRS